MRCERDALQDALRDAIEEMQQTLKLNTKDSIPGIATTRSIGLVKRQPAQPAPSYGLGAAKPRGSDFAAEVAAPKRSDHDPWAGCICPLRRDLYTLIRYLF